MSENIRRRRPLAAVLLLSSAFLGACDGDDDPTGPDFTAASAQEVAAVAEELTAPFEDATQVQANLFNAYAAIAGLGGGGSLSPMVPFEGVARTRTPFRSGATATAAGASSGPNGVLIPDAFEGTTFVWNVDSAGYVASDQGGAPANGARFIWYAVDPISAEPVEPLNPLGHLDLIDESTETQARLEVVVVRDAGDETLASYYVQGGVTGNLQTTTATIESEGFFSDGSDVLDFDMEMVFRSTDTQETWETLVELDSNEGSITLDFEQHFDDLETSHTTSGSFTIEGAGSEAVFSFEGAGSELSETVEGSLTFNGEEVVIFSGDANEPEFTRPDGSDLTADEVEALAFMWVAYGATYIFVLQALFPFLFLMAFAGF